MKTGNAIAAIVTAGALGVAVTGWIKSAHGGQPTFRAMPPGSSSAAASVPLGHVAGAAQAGSALGMANPIGDNPRSVAQGHRLYMAMNCAGCHGYKGEGGMGPKLTDTYWRYGGTPAQIYQTLVEGRPQGMPAWGRALPPVKLWELTAFVSSLGGGVPPGRAQPGLQGDRAGTTDRAPQDNAAEGGFAVEGQ